MAQRNSQARGGGDAVDADEIDLQIADNGGIAEAPSGSEYYEEGEESEGEGEYDDEDDVQQPQSVDPKVAAQQKAQAQAQAKPQAKPQAQAKPQSQAQAQAQAQARASAGGAAQAQAAEPQQQQQQQQRNSAAAAQQSDSARQREVDFKAAKRQESLRKQAYEDQIKRGQLQTRDRQQKQRESELKDAQRQQDAKSKLISEQKHRAAQDAIASRMGSLEDEAQMAGSRESNLALMNKNRGAGGAAAQQSNDQPFRQVNLANSSAEGSFGSSSTAAAPTAAQYKLTTEFFDLTFKFLTLLNSLSEIFRVTSFLELLLFFVAIIFFFVGEDRSVWFGVLALFHVARAFMGMAMGRVIPSSYDFVEKLEFNGAKQLVFSNVNRELGHKVKMLICDYYDDFERLAFLYTVLAVLTTTLDIISFFAVYGILAGRIGDLPDNLSDDAIEVGLTPLNSHLGRILVIMLYTFCDIVYILWILHFQMRLGVDERKYALRALLGKGDDMRIAFGILPKKKGQQSNSGSASQRQNDLPKNKPGSRQRQNRE